MDITGYSPFTNNSDQPILVKPEHEDGLPPKLIPPGGHEDIDGVYSQKFKYCIKVPDNCETEVTPDGKLKGDCGLLGLVPSDLHGNIYPGYPKYIGEKELEREEFEPKNLRD